MKSVAVAFAVAVTAVVIAIAVTVVVMDGVTVALAPGSAFLAFLSFAVTVVVMVGVTVALAPGSAFLAFLSFAVTVVVMVGVTVTLAPGLGFLAFLSFASFHKFLRGKKILEFACLLPQFSVFPRGASSTSFLAFSGRLLCRLVVGRWFTYRGCSDSRLQGGLAMQNVG